MNILYFLSLASTITYGVIGVKKGVIGVKGLYYFILFLSEIYQFLTSRKVELSKLEFTL